MLNTSVFFQGGDTNTNIKVNAVTGGIVKNHANSFFMRFHLKSTEAERFLSPTPFRRREATYEEKNKHREEHYSDLHYIDVPVEVLQLVVVGDMEVVAEVIDIPKGGEDGN